jgi:DNA-binding NarL/FixJ family response regulator
MLQSVVKERTMNPEISILIADDHPVFRAGLRQVIEMTAGLKVVAEAEDGTMALERVREHHPDVVVLDVDMPGMDGFEVTRALRHENLQVEVVFLTMHKDEDMFNEAMNIGVKSYVVKDSAVTDIVASIRAAFAGKPFISPVLSSYLLNRTQRTAKLTEEKPGIHQLTPTERRILKLLSENKTSKEIAGELYVSHRTIENHRANICQKLGLHGNHALLTFAIEHKSQIS